MVSVGLSVESNGLGALNQIESVPLPEQCNDLTTRGISFVPIKKSGVHA